MKMLNFWKISLIFYILTFYASNNLIGQKYSFSGDVKWQANIKSNKPNMPEMLYFENAVYMDTVTCLPYFNQKVQISGDKSLYYHIKILQPEYELFPTDQLPKNLNLKNITDTILIKCDLQKERKVPYIHYYFVPLRKNPVNGKLERLKHFNLSVESSGNELDKKIQYKTNYSQQSVLSVGNWYKFLVGKTGIYKITYDEIKNLGITDPVNVRIYGDGGKMLPEIYSGNVPSDPREIPIMMVTGNAGAFTSGDYILFYAEGPTVWRFDTLTNKYLYEKNLYSDSTAYFLTSKSGGKRISTEDIPSASSNINVTTFDGS